MSIIIKIGRSTALAGADLEALDVEASESKLAEMVAMAVIAELGEEVEVSVEEIGSTEISGVEDEDLLAEVREIEADVRQSGDWLVYKEP